MIQVIIAIATVFFGVVSAVLLQRIFWDLALQLPKGKKPVFFWVISSFTGLSLAWGEFWVFAFAYSVFVAGRELVVPLETGVFVVVLLTTAAIAGVHGYANFACFRIRNKEWDTGRRYRALYGAAAREAKKQPLTKWDKIKWISIGVLAFPLLTLVLVRLRSHCRIREVLDGEKVRIPVCGYGPCVQPGCKVHGNDPEKSPAVRKIF